MRAIIPCAGFGTRMNMDPTQSKEMLIDPITNSPIIDYHLNLCKIYNLTPLVITRADKTDLIEYCNSKEIEVLIIEAKREWPYTILKSWEKWDQHNILLLPDTKFEPHSIIFDIQLDLLLGADMSIGLHTVTNSEKWCIVKNYALHEKAKGFFGPQEAFGIIGFNRAAGISLFDGLNSGKMAKLTNTSFRYLTSFRDITRTGKVE